MNRLIRFASAGLISLVAFFIFVPVSHSEDCFSPSPSVLAGLDIYAPVQARYLNQTEYQNLEKLFDSLERRWEGTGEEFICEGREDSADKHINQYTIEAEGDLNSSGHLYLQADLYSEKERTRKIETLRLFLEKEYIRSRYDNSSGDIELIEVSYNKLVYRENYRIGSKSGGGLMKEVFTAIRSNYAVFTMERLVYTQGKLTSRFTWELRSR